MKKVLIFIVVIFVGISLWGQQKEEVPVSYIVGNENVGYPIESREIPNGYVTTWDRFPILYYYELKKEEFIGGKLFDVDNKKYTTIKDIELIITKDGSGIFKVYGKKFNMTMLTEDGYILEDNESHVLFSWIPDDEVSYFKIIKKQ